MSGQQTYKPNIKWFQNKDTVTFELDHRDIQNETIKIEPNQVSISFCQNNKNYSDNLELFKEIDDQSSTTNRTGFSINIHLKKKEQGFWKYLTKNDKAHNNIKVDWNNFEDSEEEPEDKNGMDGGRPEGMDFSSMMNQMGSPNAGGMGPDDSDSDDEDGCTEGDDCKGHDHSQEEQQKPNLDDLEKIEE